MNAAGNETLDRIQQEIQENLRREEELREKYAKGDTNNSKQPSQTAILNVLNHFPKKAAPQSASNNSSYGFPSPTSTSSTSPKSPSPVFMNGNGAASGALNKRYISNTPSTTKGMMQKFLKMRGKISMVTIKPNNQAFSSSSSPTNWSHDLEPAKVTIERGKSIRNGFIPAEEKMRRELQDFQTREAELRKERMKSQPDLMAALEAENESNLKPARSFASLYSNEDLSRDTFSPTPSSLKPARSLADLLCDDDEELDTPGTHSLIMQFESLKQARA